MAMPTTDFLTRKQMKEQIALPKVGVRYSDGSGGVKDFGVSDASELGSLDAAFAAAARGVRREQKSVHIPVRAKEGSGVVVRGNEVMLAGEDTGGNRRPARFFGTDGSIRVGWHDIDEIDRPEYGAIVGKTMNSAASADESKKEVSKSNYAWSYETSRTAFKKDEDGIVSLYNYYRTFYVSKMGRIVGCSEEREVLIGSIEGGGGDYCVSPVVDANGNVTGMKFGTAKQLKDDTPSKTADLDKYGVKAVFSSGILRALKFGSRAQLDANSPANTVNTQVGCPYQS